MSSNEIPHSADIVTIDDGNDIDILTSISEEYAVCEPAPKHTHALFDVVRTMQREFDEYRYASLELAMRAAEPFVVSVNQTMEQDGLLDRPILMTGSEIYHPRSNLDLATNTMITAPRERPDANDIEAGYDSDEVSGIFAGIWYVPRPVELGADEGTTITETSDGGDDEAPVQYRISLFYQAEVGGCRYLLGEQKRYASSPVHSTTIEYYDDMHLRYVREALDQLLTVESVKVATLVNDLNVALAKPRHTALGLRTIATLVRDIHATGELRSGDTEALLNLITAYIDPQGLYDIEVPDALGYEVTDEGRVVELLTPANDGQPRYAQQCSEIIFTEGYDRDKRDQSVVHFNPKGVLEPFFVFEDDDIIVHVPMRRLRKFKRLG